MDYVLAFKGVTDNNESAYVSGLNASQDVRRLLSRTYKVGETHNTHPRFPMWLVACYDTTGHELCTGCDSYIEKVLLVKVPRQALRNQAVFATAARGKTIDELVQYVDTNGYGTQRALSTPELEVLEEVDIYHYGSVHKAMSHYERKYDLPRATSEIAQANEQESK